MLNSGNEDVACITKGNTLESLHFKKKEGYKGTKNNIDQCLKMVKNNIDLCSDTAGEKKCAYVSVDDDGQCWAISSDGLNTLQSTQLLYYPNLDTSCSNIVYKTENVDSHEHVLNSIINKYKTDIAKTSKTTEEEKARLEKNKVILEYLYSMSDEDKNKQFGSKSMNQIIDELETQQKNKELTDNLKNTVEQTNAMIDNLYIINTAKESIANNNNISANIINAQTNITQKIKNDINKIDWSINEINRQEHIQNKIASLLGVLIVLFVFLGIFMFLYYMSGVSYSTIVKKTDAFTSIFSGNKKGKITKPIKQSTIQSTINNIFK